jgi:LmbE family N-acetylglucosaminyl deacetylase
MSAQNRILIIAAHPDDEVIGMGGSINFFSEKQNKVAVVFLSSGVGSRNEERQSAESRMLAAEKSLLRLGSPEIYFCDFPDNKFDTVPKLDIIKTIEYYVDKFAPNKVFTNYFDDLNIDHQITSEATQVAVRPKPNSPVNELYYFEVPSSTGWKFGTRAFNPNYFIDISKNLKAKLRALEEYKVELDQEPGARSIIAIESLARLRGSSVGVIAAEAFEIAFIRKINE